MKDLTKIITRLDYFNADYTMSEAQGYDRGVETLRFLKATFAECTKEELIKIKNETRKSESTLLKFFSEYFEGLEVVAPKKSEKLVTVMRTAWAMLKNGLFTSMSEALTASWKRYKLVKLLQNGIARFEYAKANGVIRKAIGTLRNGNFHYESKTTGTGTKAELLWSRFSYCSYQGYM